LEALFSPTRDLRINANFGYLDTEVGEGARSIDITNRTQSNPNYVVAKPWVQLPSNCIVPVEVAENYVLRGEYYPQIPGYLGDGGGGVANYWGLCGGWMGLGPEMIVIDPATGAQYDPLDYPEINGGAGLYQDLEGNE